MSIHRRDAFDGEAAEQLLRGAATARNADGLRARLAAATTSPFPGEFAGEHEAVAAFRAGAQLTAVAPAGRSSMIRPVLAKLLTLKAAAVLALAGGGVAL